MPAHWWMELGHVPLVGRAMFRSVFIGGCELSKALGTQSVDRWVCVPILLVVWPEAFQHWSLVGCWVRPSLDAKVAISGRAHTEQSSLGPLTPVCLTPAVSHS